VGKSTQAQRLAGAFPYYNPRLSSGELVRAHIEADTELGRRLKVYYNQGERVPDTDMLPLVLPHVRRMHGWSLDNFPATAAQARALDAELGDLGLSRVISLEGPTDEELIERVLSDRVRGRATGLVYHLVHDPPPRPEERSDPGPFERREDDTEEALRRHLEAHRQEIEPLKEHYEAKGLLTVVDARRSVDDIAVDVLEALGRPDRPRYYAS
jgi:adenylate kinase